MKELMRLLGGGYSPPSSPKSATDLRRCHLEQYEPLNL